MGNIASSTPRLLTVPETARELNVSPGHVWNMVKREQIPYVRLGRSIRIARAVVERIVTEATDAVAS